MGLSIGIDLGTTNSVAGVATPEGVRLAVDANGKSVHASVVSFPEKGGLIVGNAAKVRKATEPTQTIYSAKRLIGQNVRAPLVQLAMAALPYRVEEGQNQQPVIDVAGRRMMVPELSALVLTHIKRLCEDQFGDEVTGAVITVPANFSDAQRQGTKEAGRLAGLEVLRLVNEPTAAALAYGYGQHMDQRVAVFDFGGGTFDLSLLKIDSDIFEVLATDGEFFLGGDDIDRIVAEFLAAEMNRAQGIDPRPIPTAMNRLNIAAEQIKQYLTANYEAGGTIDGIVIGASGRSVSIEFELTRERFDSMIEGYVDRTIDVCRNVLASTGLQVSDISDVIMVGGSTRIPLVRDRLAEFFGKEPAGRINPDEVVAHGAAIQAAMLAGAVHNSQSNEEEAPPLAENAVPMSLAPPDVQDAQREARPASSALLLDVTPAALRIATAGGYSEAFLEKNSPIPIERTQIFTTAHENQDRVIILCCRGSEKRYEDNEILGTLELENIPPGARGEAQIEVTFRVDPDCILHVRARELRTNNAVEARLNVIGAPMAESPSDAADLIASTSPRTVEGSLAEDNPGDDKKSAKAAAKEERERLKREKKESKVREKEEKRADKERKNLEKRDAK